MGGLGRSIEICCSGYGGFVDVARFRNDGFGNLQLLLGNRVFRDVLLNGSDVLSGPVIPLAMGLYVVTVWSGCTVDNGSRDVGVFC